jgi:dimethylargininase
MIALVRGLGDRFSEALRTFMPEQPLDVAAARLEHGVYVRALETAGCRVVRLPASPEHPDAPFVEDTAVVLGRVALMGRSGAPSRRGEEGPVAVALAEQGIEVRYLPEGATLEGGDVLHTGGRVFVGRSRRTDMSGVEAVASLARSLGLGVTTLCVDRCLHLKTAVSAVDAETVLVNPAWLDPALLSGLRIVRVPLGEPMAANVACAGRFVLHAAADKVTGEMVGGLGYDTIPLPFGELRKAEAGPTCLSLLLPGPA